MCTLEGVSNVANFIIAYEVSQQNRDSHFLICSVLFVSKGTLFDVYSSYCHHTHLMLHSSWMYVSLDP